MSDKLTPGELECVRQEVSDYADWLLSYLPGSDAHSAGGAMHALLAHAAALEAENATLRKAGEKLAQTWRAVAVSKEETAASYFRSGIQSGNMYADALKHESESAMLSACAKSLDELFEDAANG